MLRVLSFRFADHTRHRRAPRLTTRSWIPPVCLLLTTTLAADPSIEATTRDDGTYQFTLTSQEPLEVAEGQAAILAEARQLCSEGTPQLGRYRFSKNEPVDGGPPADADQSDADSLVLVQDIFCSSPLPPRDREPTRPLTPDDKEVIESEVRALTTSYLHAPSTGEYRKPYSMLTDIMKSMSPFEIWQKEREKFVAESGSIQETDVWRMTIYVDPPSAPEPGIYVAADYEMSFENVPFKCGYIIWVEQPDGTYRITREDYGLLDDSTLAAIDEAEIPLFKSRMGCRDP